MRYLGLILALLAGGFCQAQTAIKLDSSDWHPFVWAPQAVFQWTIDPDTDRLNFRRCDSNKKTLVRTCRTPILTSGIDPARLPVLIDYFLDRLEKFGSILSRNFWIAVFGFSATGIASGTTLVSGVEKIKENMPDWMENFFDKNGHQITAAIVGGALVYYGGMAWLRSSRQSAIAIKFQNAREMTPDLPPEIHLRSHAMFEEFYRTFKLVLWEFTHSGTVPYRAGSNKVLD